jgi:chromosome segregation ATPase
VVAQARNRQRSVQAITEEQFQESQEGSLPATDRSYGWGGEEKTTAGPAARQVAKWHKEHAEMIEEAKLSEDAKVAALTSCGVEIVALRRKLRKAKDHNQRMQGQGQELDRLQALFKKKHAKTVSAMPRNQLAHLLLKFHAAYGHEKAMRGSLEMQMEHMSQALSRVDELQARLGDVQGAHSQQQSVMLDLQKRLREAEGRGGMPDKYKRVMVSQQQVVEGLERVLKEKLEKFRPLQAASAQLARELANAKQSNVHLSKQLAATLQMPKPHAEEAGTILEGGQVSDLMFKYEAAMGRIEALEETLQQAHTHKHTHTHTPWQGPHTNTHA